MLGFFQQHYGMAEPSSNHGHERSREAGTNYCDVKRAAHPCIESGTLPGIKTGKVGAGAIDKRMQWRAHLLELRSQKQSEGGDPWKRFRRPSARTLQLYQGCPQPFLHYHIPCRTLAARAK